MLQIATCKQTFFHIKCEETLRNFLKNELVEWEIFFKIFSDFIV